VEENYPMRNYKAFWRKFVCCDKWQWPGSHYHA